MMIKDIWWIKILILLKIKEINISINLIKIKISYLKINKKIKNILKNLLINMIEFKKKILNDLFFKFIIIKYFKYILWLILLCICKIKF